MDAFEDSVSYDINTKNELPDYDIYLIELYDAKKETSIKLRTLFKNKLDNLIYFIIPQDYSLLLFQLTFLLETKAIITQNQDTTKVISKIKNDHKEHIKKNIEKIIGHIGLHRESFMIYRQNKLYYVSDQLLEIFRCDNKEMFEKKFIRNIDITMLLEEDLVFKQTIENSARIAMKYILKSVTTLNKEKIIYVDLETSEDKKLDFMSSRITFIETLKERIIQQDSENNKLSAITITLKNMKKMQKELGSVDVNG
jgi:hypothetical protein